MSVKVHVQFTVQKDVDKFKSKAMEVVKTSKARLYELFVSQCPSVLVWLLAPSQRISFSWTKYFSNNSNSCMTLPDSCDYDYVWSHLKSRVTKFLTLLEKPRLYFLWPVQGARRKHLRHHRDLGDGGALRRGRGQAPRPGLPQAVQRLHDIRLQEVLPRLDGEVEKDQYCNVEFCV